MCRDRTLERRDRIQHLCRLVVSPRTKAELPPDSVPAFFFPDQQLANQNLDPNNPDYNLNAMANLNAIYVRPPFTSRVVPRSFSDPTGQSPVCFCKAVRT